MGVDSVGGSSRSSSSRSSPSDSTRGLSSPSTADATKTTDVTQTAENVAQDPAVASPMSFDASSFEAAKDLSGMPNLMSSTPIGEVAAPEVAFDPVQSLEAMPELLAADPLSPTPQTFVSDFSVPEGQLTFDAEGQEVRGAYFSREAHRPGGASGVTIGRGYDMKNRTEETVVSDLVAAGVPRADAEVLSKGAGLTGQEADDFVDKPEVKAVEISPMAQKNLFSTVYDTYEADVKRISEKPDTVAKYGSVDFDKLDPAIKDVAVDLIYRGDYTPTTRKEVQQHLVNNDLQGLKDLLSDETKMTGDWNVPQDRFERRRDYLQAALDAQ